MKTVIQILVIPFLVVIYLSAAIPLLVRQAAHIATCFMDWLFDFVAGIAGMDTRFWPLPKVSEEQLPFSGKDT